MATAILPTTQLTFDKPEVSVFSGTEGAYLLPHNQDEIERLQRQHRFLKTATNDKLVAVPLPNGATVLDSGCADGKSIEWGRHLQYALGNNPSCCCWILLPRCYWQIN